jgi:hypothetical protein
MLVNDDFICDYKHVITLTYEGYYTYIRKYYLVKFFDSSEAIYMTTNEPNDTETCMNKFMELDKEYIIFRSFEEIIENFYKLDLYFTTEVKFLPQYIFMNIEYMVDDFKKLFEKDLIEFINNYDLEEIDDTIWANIKYWMTRLVIE